MFGRMGKKVLLSFDWKLTLLLVLLCSFGLVVLYSAGYNPETGQSMQMKRQAASMGVGAVIFTLCLFIRGSFWRRSAIPIYIICCLMLAAILGMGVVAKGARRWLELGGFRMQPSEFMKIGLILLLARVFSRDEQPKDGMGFFQLLVPGAILLLPVALIVVQPDLGTALSLMMIGGTMTLLAGIKPKILLRLAIVALIAAPFAWHRMHDYQQERILNFLTPERDPRGSGYHAIQSKIAVGSGALMGKGFLRGTQTQLRFLPEQTTDFIFSVLAEEWGFLGTALVLGLYLLIVVRLLRLALRSTDRFQSFVTVGVGALLFWHTFVNIGMVIDVMPVVGITLPLLSYGGSSVITVISGLGIVCGLNMRRYMFA